MLRREPAGCNAEPIQKPCNQDSPHVRPACRLTPHPKKVPFPNLSKCGINLARLELFPVRPSQCEMDWFRGGEKEEESKEKW
jgi:hypothetical protein